jgi:NADH:ubiquinone oxidoreductase subunit E
MQKLTGVEKKHREWEEKNSTKLLSKLCIQTFCHGCGAEKELRPVKTKQKIHRKGDNSKGWNKFINLNYNG